MIGSAPWRGCWGERFQVCLEPGVRVSNLHVRDMDLDEGRRLEVVAYGLTLWQGAQIATDTTLVTPLRRDGSSRPRAADHGRRRKERTYPELSGDGLGHAGPCCRVWRQVEH